MAFGLFPSQLSQGDAQAYPVAAADVTVDDDGSDRDMTRAGATFPCRTKLLVDFNIGCTQFIECARQIGLRVRTHLRRQVTRVEQHEFGSAGFGGAHLNDKVLQVIASA